jgi:hypothetical protein
MARVYPVRVGNTEGSCTENRALFTSLSDRTHGYKFLCKYMEVRSFLFPSWATQFLINNIRNGVGGSPMSCFPRAGQNFSFLANLL